MPVFADVSDLGHELMEWLVDLYYVFFIAGLAFGLAAYVLISMSYYSIAGRRGIAKPWLAWIPVGNPWILGSISDHYQLQTHYCTKNMRKILLWLQIILIILLILLLIFTATTLIETIEVSKPENQRYPFIDFWKPVRDGLRGMLLLYTVMAVIALVSTAVQYIALYDLYRSCCPDSAALFLVLSILLPVVMPFLIFGVRNKDLGMRME